MILHANFLVYHKLTINTVLGQFSIVVVVVVVGSLLILRVLESHPIL